MTPMRWEDRSLSLLDQTLLPGEVKWNTYRDYRPVVDDIKRLAVRGAPLIGVAAAYAYVLAGVVFGAPLAYYDVSGYCCFSRENLYTKTFAFRIASVLGTADSFLVCHFLYYGFSG